MTDNYLDYLIVDIDDPDVEEPPTGHEILQLVEGEGVVGEQDTILTIAVMAFRGGLIGVIGISRGGKNFTLEETLDAVYGTGAYYEWSTADDSDTYIYYKAAELDAHEIHYLGDVARMTDQTELAMKSFGEGRPLTRGKTDISRAEGDEAVDQEIKCPRTSFFTIATDNRNISLEDYPEANKRSFKISVDGTQSQTEAILRRKALERMGQAPRYVPPRRKAEIQRYMNNIPVEAFHEHPSNWVANPMAGEMVAESMLPTNFVEARFDGDRLFDIVENVTMMNHTARFTVDTGTCLVLLATPVDVWFTMQVVGNNMVMSSLNLSDEDQAVLRFMREHDGTPDRKEVQQGLRKAGYAITDKDVSQSLESMRERGYVEEHDSTPKTFSLSSFAPITEFKVDLDYSKIAEAAATEVYNIPGVPESVADEYVRRFCEGDGLKTVHPFTGELVDITEDTSLQDAMNEATQDIADIFDTPFGKPATAENAADEGQSELGASSSASADAGVVSDGGLDEFSGDDAPIDDDADEGTLV